MQYKLTLLAVKDVEVSKRFYTELFDQEVVLDLGCNVTFSGGVPFNRSLLGASIFRLEQS